MLWIVHAHTFPNGKIRISPLLIKQVQFNKWKREGVVCSCSCSCSGLAYRPTNLPISLSPSDCLPCALCLVPCAGMRGVLVLVPAREMHAGIDPDYPPHQDSGTIITVDNLSTLFGIVFSFIGKHLPFAWQSSN